MTVCMLIDSVSERAQIDGKMRGHGPNELLPLWYIQTRTTSCDNLLCYPFPVPNVASTVLNEDRRERFIVIDNISRARGP